MAVLAADDRPVHLISCLAFLLRRCLRCSRKGWRNLQTNKNPDSDTTCEAVQSRAAAAKREPRDLITFGNEN